MARKILCRVISWDPLCWAPLQPHGPILDGDEYIYRHEVSGELLTLGRSVGGGFGFVREDDGTVRGWREVADDEDEPMPRWAEELTESLARLAGRHRRPGGLPRSDDWIDDVLAGLPTLLSYDEVAEVLNISRRTVERAVKAGLLETTINLAVRGDREKERIRIPRLTLRTFLRRRER